MTLLTMQSSLVPWYLVPLTPSIFISALFWKIRIVEMSLGIARIRLTLKQDTFHIFSLLRSVRTRSIQQVAISWSVRVVTSCWRRHSRRTRNFTNTALIYTSKDMASYPESGVLSMYLCGSVLCRRWRYMKEAALCQTGGSISKKWRCTKEVAPYTGGSAIRRGWRHIKKVALYQRGGAIWRCGAIWRGSAISRKWRYIKEVAPCEGMAPY
jgi:hypothetical protein